MKYKPDESNLTPREQEIFNMLLAGKTPKEIAYELKIAYSTVIGHQNNIYRKLDVHNIDDFLIKFRPIGKPIEMENAFKAGKYKTSLGTAERKSDEVDFWMPLFGGKLISAVAKNEDGVAVTGLRYEKDGDCLNIAGKHCPPDTSNLTPREQEVFKMLTHGKTPKEIAHELKISYHTVIMNQKSIYRKLEVQNINDLLIKFHSVEKILDIEPHSKLSKKSRKSLGNIKLYLKKIIELEKSFQ
jgi:DNA-binding CsgD family transcriptional regulator